MLLSIAGLVVICEITLCALGFARIGESHPLAKALETTGGFLMTLNSPDGLKPSSDLLLIARCLGWMVSFMGWLTLPLLLAITLSRSQNVEHERLELCYNLLKRAERLNMSPPEALPLVSETMTGLEKFPSENRNDRNTPRSNGATREDEA